MKVIDAKGYLDALCELTQQGKTVTTIVTGGSMEPFLSSNRDSVMLENPKGDLARGDIVLFCRINGDYVLHRIHHITSEGYYLVGDRQRVIEGPVKREDIKAVVKDASHKGRWIGKKSFRWWFFKAVWLRIIPLRNTICAVYGCLRRGRRKAFEE